MFAKNLFDCEDDSSDDESSPRDESAALCNTTAARRPEQRDVTCVSEKQCSTFPHQLSTIVNRSVPLELNTEQEAGTSQLQQRHWFVEWKRKKMLSFNCDTLWIQKQLIPIRNCVKVPQICLEVLKVSNSGYRKTLLLKDANGKVDGAINETLCHILSDCPLIGSLLLLENICAVRLSPHKYYLNIIKNNLRAVWYLDKHKKLREISFPNDKPKIG